ncbi:MAG: hypothetical protein AB8B57_14225 [Congregibacter sp.]
MGVLASRRYNFGAAACALSLAVAIMPVAVFTLASSPVQAEQAVTVNAAVFSSEQAKTGRSVFRKHCKSCHEEEYFDTVMRVWNGEPLSELFSVMAATMPQNNPGSLRDQEYLDVLAYVLFSLGYPNGDHALDSKDLLQTRIEPQQ